MHTACTSSMLRSAFRVGRLTKQAKNRQALCCSDRTMHPAPPDSAASLQGQQLRSGGLWQSLLRQAATKRRHSRHCSDTGHATCAADGRGTATGSRGHRYCKFYRQRPAGKWFRLGLAIARHWQQQPMWWFDQPKELQQQLLADYICWCEDQQPKKADSTQQADTQKARLQQLRQRRSADGF